MKFKVTKRATRPAQIVKDRCFYCGRKIGSYHRKGCVLVIKKVLIRAIVEYEIDMPSTWKKEDIEFNRNEGTWCSDNMINELKQVIKKQGCLCGSTKFEYLKTTSGSYLEED